MENNDKEVEKLEDYFRWFNNLSVEILEEKIKEKKKRGNHQRNKTKKSAKLKGSCL